jgi:signal transduction histidine kinase
MSDTTSVLIVDDDRHLCESMADVLRANGYQARTASSGAQGLARLAEALADVAVVDIKLPDVSGLELLDSIKRASPATEVVFVTAFASIDTAVEAINGAALAYLPKPFEMSQLLAAVQRARERHRLRRALRELEEERSRLEQRLRHAQRMEAVGQLAGGIVHDFNNLLTIINARLEAVQERLPAAEPLRQELEQVFDTTSRAAALSGQLVAFSRKAGVEPRVVALNDVVRRSASLLGHILGDHIELAVRLAPEAGRVRVDPGQLEQVIVNLVVNARDALAAGGVLTIETRAATLDASETAGGNGGRPGAYAVLAVSDTGTGMDEPTRARVFEAFFTTKAPGHGTGLGLATAHTIVTQSGGFITVASELGAGTTFEVYLPRTEDPNEAAASAPESALPRGTETVLLVEDEPEVRQVAHEMLAKLGYAVLEAADGPEALRIARGHDAAIHVLLTDVVMPRMSGHTLAATIADMRPDTKVLFMSGYAAHTAVGRGLPTRAGRLIEKPFTARALAVTVREVLDSGVGD